MEKDTKFQNMISSFSFKIRTYIIIYQSARLERELAKVLLFFSPMWEHQKMAAKAAVSMYTTGKDPSKRSVMECSTITHANHLVDGLLQIARQQVITCDIL